MKAQYANDAAKGPGYGFFRISDTGRMGSLEGLGFSLKRASDQKTLGQSGWQPAGTVLPVDGVALADDGFDLAVGPEVVNALDPRETYRLTLVFADGGTAAGPLSVPEVAYSPISGGQGLYVAATPEPAPEPVTEPGPEPTPEPEPAPSQDALPLAPPDKKRSLVPLLAPLLVLALAGGGFLAWKFLWKPDAAPQADVNATEQASSNATGQATPEVPAPGETPSAPSAGEPVTVRAPLAVAREHLAGKADARTGLALARELLARKGGEDAAFLLAEDAAQKGDAEAMLYTAGFYDPVRTGPSGSIQKDAAEALNWYKKARDAGRPEAGARLAALKAWAEAEAAKGSREARLLLDRF